MPEIPVTYTQTYTICRHDGDHHGNAKPGALLRYGQQIATMHAEAAGLNDELYAATHTAYVLAKLALHIDRTPRVDETLTVTTRPERCKRAVNKRITFFNDAAGRQVAVLDSRWVLIDTDKRLILRKHPEAFNDCWAEDVPFELPMKMVKAVPEDCTPAGEYTATYSRCDMNGHMNNTRYVDILCDALPWNVWDEGEVRDLKVYYHREVPRGASFALLQAQTGEKQYYFCGQREEKAAFEASITFA
ncbi:MAG TPA: acyl-ACP thioesterase [Candidatus Gemmiger excrementipullorum]|uniref:Acyl-ACP thioesterase n=1 Tax=Candidatus Gemmiger excrementipullorum TaxID=2838610 RepID=A0A9D1Y063_9FIRM|nr:acyl-ACP thioesterase [Candidatus Gemmiger excrementipullorum]